MKKLFYWILFFIFLGAFLHLFYIFLENIREEKNIEGGNFEVAVIGKIASMHPLISPLREEDWAISSILYPGLIKKNTITNDTEFDLASNITSSKDAKIITITLRSNITWHDGKPLTADDVIFTYEFLQNPKFPNDIFIGSSINKKRLNILANFFRFLLL